MPTTEKITKKQRDICEQLEWTIHEEPDGTVELEAYSPAGEDFIFTVNVKDFAREVERYAEDFDIDEHIALWIEAKRNGTAGVPSVRELVKDAEDIQKMLNELAEALNEGSRTSIKEIIKEGNRND